MDLLLSSCAPVLAWALQFYHIPLAHTPFTDIRIGYVVAVLHPRSRSVALTTEAPTVIYQYPRNKFFVVINVRPSDIFLFIYRLIFSSNFRGDDI
jgi:hypothetical protein